MSGRRASRLTKSEESELLQRVKERLALAKIAMTPHVHSESGCADMCPRCIAEYGLTLTEAP